MNIGEFIMNNLGGITGALAVFGAVAFYIGALRNLLKQVAELINEVVEALDDNQITKEEVAQITKEFNDVIAAIKAFKK